MVATGPPTREEVCVDMSEMKTELIAMNTKRHKDKPTQNFNNSCYSSSNAKLYTYVICSFILFSINKFV